MATKKCRIVLKPELYKEKLENIDFAKDYLHDYPEIFNVHSQECKTFLIYCFTTLRPNFHYLSLCDLNVLDRELIKAARILQIYPGKTNLKSGEWFGNADNEDIHYFWIRFFQLCSLHALNKESHTVKTHSQENEYKFSSCFSELNSAFKYFDDTSTVDSKKHKQCDLNAEIASWKDFVKPRSDISNVHNNTVTIFNTQRNFSNPDMSQFSQNIELIKKRAKELQQGVQYHVPYFTEFFIKFNCVLKETHKYNGEIQSIFSSTAEDISNALGLYSNYYWMSNNSQIERCNILIDNIKNKREQYNQVKNLQLFTNMK